MKHIKSYEKLIRNTDPRVLNHPLLNFSGLIKDILTKISILDSPKWDNNIARVSRYFSDDNKIEINYDKRFKIHLNIDKKRKIETDYISMTVFFSSFYINDANQNSFEFFQFIYEKLKKYVQENDQNYRKTYKYKTSDVKYIIDIFNEYNELLEMKLTENKYNL